MPDSSLFREPRASRLPLGMVFSPVILGAVLLLAVGVLSGGLVIVNRGREGRRSELVEQNAIKEGSVRPELVASIVSLDSGIKSAREALGRHTFSSNVFQVLETATHPQVRFTNFSFAADSLKAEMAGEAASYSVLARQVSFFEQNPFVSRVDFGGLSSTGEGLIGFKVSLTFKPALLRLRQ